MGQAQSSAWGHFARQVRGVFNQPLHRSARSPPSCPNCCRSAGRSTPARCAIGRCASARTSCRRTLPRPRSRQQHRRPAVRSWSGWIAATSAIGTGVRGAASRRLRATSLPPIAASTDQGKDSCREFTQKPPRRGVRAASSAATRRAAAMSPAENATSTEESAALVRRFVPEAIRDAGADTLIAQQSCGTIDRPESEIP